MPSALSAPICGPTSRNGACITRTSVERKAKQMSIAAISVIAIFTMVHRKSSRCSRNGFEVSLSGSSRNLKMSRSAIWIDNRSAPVKREKTTRREPRTHTQRVCVADFILADHAAEVLHAEFAAVENRFPFVARGCLFAPLNRTCQKKVAVFVSETGRRKIITELGELAVFGQFITGLLAQFSQGDRFDLFLVLLEHVVDLAGGHFPNCGTDRHAFLANEDDFSITCHWRDDHGGFAANHGPGRRLWTRWRSNVVGYDFKMRVRKMDFTANRFPTISILDKLSSPHAGRLWSE